MSIFIHQTSVVDEGAKIGNGTKVWHFSHISSGAKIGCFVTIGQNVYVGNTSIIGDHCKIQNNVSVYDNVVLEEDVFCGPSVVFTNVINPRSSIERKNEYKDTLVLKGASLGANCTIICGVKIGAYSFVGAGAVVREDIPPFAVVAGVPAKQIGWISEHGDKLNLPLTGDCETKCNISGDTYILKGNKLFKKE